MPKSLEPTLTLQVKTPSALSSPSPSRFAHIKRTRNKPQTPQQPPCYHTTSLLHFRHRTESKSRTPTLNSRLNSLTLAFPQEATVSLKIRRIEELEAKVRVSKKVKIRKNGICCGIGIRRMERGAGRTLTAIQLTNLRQCDWKTASRSSQNLKVAVRWMVV